MKGKLIVLEGIDGTGKTTLAKGLVRALKQRGIPAVRYEDYERKSEGFNLMKPFIKESAPVDSSLFFYVASALYKSQVIERLLSKHWIICDRYIYSTLASHQARGARVRLMPALKKLPLRLPDFGFLLTTKDAVRLQRVRARKRNNPQDFERKVPGSFVSKMERALRTHRLMVLDNTNLTVEQTVSAILRRIGLKPVL